MDKKIKKVLSDVYRAPEPIRKKSFLKRYRRRELNCWDLITTQAGYIRWWVWGLSATLFAVILMITLPTESQLHWSASALTPFLALLVVTENGKARLHGMEELELACRTPVRSAVLARMVVLGLFHLALLGLLTPALAIRGAVGIARAGVYLLTPYLLTAGVGLELTRHIRDREGLLACASVAALVSVLGIVIGRLEPIIYRLEAMPYWIVALLLVTITMAIELKLELKETEGLQWN